ncbi:fumarylacetoacetate hydrolase family protein [Geomicrobium sp. JSM 1781026]|uniref:fumarylacetoacetate hydrolase family protein n=1 Tax=Geomicrobium sp. JSM 1781026 TaxID=3344580 RepID=UPI0035C1C408
MILLRYITFIDPDGNTSIGLLKNNHVYDFRSINNEQLPTTMLDFMKNHEQFTPLIADTLTSQSPTYEQNEVTLLPPIPTPPSIRDFMAFEEHIVNATKQSGITLADEWYEIPAFYFTNHLALSGHKQTIVRPRDCKALDYELEIACVIGKEGINITADEAEDYIFGYTILNDWSARDLQMKEMKVGLGPAKGKDFATSIGPAIVSKDELDSFRIGDKYDLSMKATVNGKELSKGNFKDIHYSFGQMIERASSGVRLYPGDIIGSGTVGTGCLLELGRDVHRWLEPGDVIELEIEGIGKLLNTIVE